MHGCGTLFMSSWLHAGTCACTFIKMFTQQEGETPLHHAARSGNTEVVNALLKAGSNVDEKDEVSMF